MIAPQAPLTDLEMRPGQVAVAARDAGSLGDARRLADELALPFVDNPAAAQSYPLLVVAGGDLIDLQLTGPRAPGPVSCAFDTPAMRHRRRGGQNELLGRAVGVGKQQALRVIDCTAGFARDAFVLADLGAEVLLCERQPVVAAMLARALHSSKHARDSWLRSTAGRLCLFAQDARTLPQERIRAAQVLYLDPMFPERGRRAAAAKEMAVLQYLQGPVDAEAEAAALFGWAVQQRVSRIVVKRPLKAPALEGLAVNHTLRGRAVRFDVYVA